MSNILEWKVVQLSIQHFPSFMKALGVTLEISVISLVFATILGIVFGMFKISKIKPLVILNNVYTSVIRGTPLMVQILFIYFGVPMVFGFKWPAFSIGSWKVTSLMSSGIIIMTINAGAYMSELVRGGIEAVNVGQMEAARSSGLTYAQAMVKVILPQAFRIMLPSLINQFICTLKDTSLLSVIGLRELTQNTKIVVANNMESFTMYFIAGVYYWIIVNILTLVAGMIERRTSYGK